MSRRFAVRLFGPGLPGGGAATDAFWQAGHLVLSGGEGRWTVPVSALTMLKASGFNHDQWQFVFRQEGADFVAFVDASAHQTLLAEAPAALQGPIAGARRQRWRTRQRFRALWGALALLAVLPLAALLWLGFNLDRVAGWAVDRVPVAQEQQLGELVLDQTRRQMKLLDQGPAVDAVRRIGEQVLAAGGGSRFQYRWFVAEQPAINAFAAPGGVVVVFSGLIEKVRRPEELAGVLAHEIGHAELRHSLRLMVKNLGLRALTSALLGDLSGVLADATAGLTELSFSRDAEHQADDFAIDRLLRAGIDPAGLVSFFELLGREAKTSRPVFLSTHPDTAERIARLRARLPAPGGGTTPLALDLAPARAALRRP